MKLLLPDHLVDSLGEQVCRIAPECELVLIDADGQIKQGDLDDTEVFFLRWGLSSEVFERLISQIPNLSWVHSISAGVDHIPLAELAEMDVLLTNASGVFNVPIAETVLSYILAVVKRLPEFFEQQRTRQWRKLSLRELRGLTVGIVGFGDIGAEVARLCRAFGAHVLDLRRSPQPSEHADEILPPSRLHNLLARSDFVVIAIPLTRETRGLIGRAELAAMKGDGWLINIARGEVVDEDALIEALQERRIGGACLDVFVEEPLPQDSPLWDLPNVIIMPHNAWSSPHLEEREAALFLENLRRYVAGKPMLNVVDKETGY